MAPMGDSITGPFKASYCPQHMALHRHTSGLAQEGCRRQLETLTIGTTHAPFSVARGIFRLALPGNRLREHIDHYPVGERRG